MLAVVKIAGQQFKVKAGDSLYVPHIAGKTGDQVEFADVLMTDSDGTVIAFKMKRRKGFRKKHGHRTQYTHIKVTAIA
jgi:large subunit ribosomal protein L21